MKNAAYRFGDYTLSRHLSVLHEHLKMSVVALHLPKTYVSSGHAHVGELDVTIVDTVSSHLFANIANVDTGKQGEGPGRQQG